jgi:hypothetical protein
MPRNLPAVVQLLFAIGSDTAAPPGDLAQVRRGGGGAHPQDGALQTVLFSAGRPADPGAALARAMTVVLPSTATSAADNSTPRARHGLTAAASFGVSESVLVADVLYAIQGISGRHVVFSPGDDTFAVDPKVRARRPALTAQASITRPARDLLLRLSELGWLFRRLAVLADSRGAAGLVAQVRAVHGVGLVDRVCVVCVIPAYLCRLVVELCIAKELNFSA